jgi:glutamine amidotransferase
LGREEGLGNGGGGVIAIVDYGMGNLTSVQKAFEAVGATARVTASPAAVRRAGRLILPGVGAFGEAMAELKARRLVDPIKGFIREGKPFLGICLGLQLLFDSSEENEGVDGLGVLRGTVKRFSFQSTLHPPPSTLKIPHMGWNQIIRHQTSDIRHQNGCPLLTGIPDGSYFYFVHSYYGAPQDPSVVALETEYGTRFASMVWRNRLFATQFHPEKSQSIGLRLLKNFIDLA